MRRPLYFLVFLVLGACLVWFLRAHPSCAPLATSELEGSPGAVEPALSAADQAAEHAVYEQQTKAWVAKIESLETKKRLRAQADAKMDQTRGWLQRDKRDAWTELISTNREAFLALRDKARHSTNGATACTICDGRGRLAFCILCNHNDGKCVTCGGTGKASGEEICPTCLGSGKCYLCMGTGRMTCPFCDDGMIRRNGPQPAQVMPLR
jgi:hypothetical protein